MRCSAPTPSRAATATSSAACRSTGRSTLLRAAGQAGRMTERPGAARRARRAGRDARRHAGARGPRRRLARPGAGDPAPVRRDRARPRGRPLAGAVVDRWLRRTARGLGGGIALPFAMALLEYDLDPQQLALDVAAGCGRPRPRGGAPARARPARRRRGRGRAPRAGRARAHRRRPDRPPRDHRACSATRPDRGSARPSPSPTSRAPSTRSASWSPPASTSSGSRCRSAASSPTGSRTPAWRSRVARRRRPVPAPSSARASRRTRAGRQPAGAGRAPARSPTASPPSVAATSGSRRPPRPSGRPRTRSSRPSSGSTSSRRTRWPRSSPTGVDPDRALSDHAFAHRLHRRAGTLLMIGAGSLVVAPDLRSGIPSDPATRAGRALALQLLAVALARRRRPPADQLAVGALPAWLDRRAGRRRPGDRRGRGPPRALRRPSRWRSSSRTRRPTRRPTGRTSWPSGLVGRATSRLVIRRPGRTQAVGRETRAAAAWRPRCAGAREPARLSRRRARPRARRDRASRMATLDMLADRGWRAVAGDATRCRRGAGARRGRGRRADGAVRSVRGDCWATAPDAAARTPVRPAQSRRSQDPVGEQGDDESLARRPVERMAQQRRDAVEPVGDGPVREVEAARGLPHVLAGIEVDAAASGPARRPCARVREERSELAVDDRREQGVVGQQEPLDGEVVGVLDPARRDRAGGRSAGCR